jgi:hypothetical protein
MRVVKMTRAYEAIKVLSNWSTQFENSPKIRGRLTAIEKKEKELLKAKRKYHKIVREYLELRLAKIRRGKTRAKKTR